MLPMRAKTVFTSRWWALIWAAGIIWMTTDFVSEQHQSESPNTASNVSDDAQIAQLANMMDTAKAR